MASATPGLWLPSHPKLVLMHLPREGWQGLSRLGWLVTYRDSLPSKDGHPSRYQPCPA